MLKIKKAYGVGLNVQDVKKTIHDPYARKHERSVDKNKDYSVDIGKVSSTLTTLNNLIQQQIGPLNEAMLRLQNSGDDTALAAYEKSEPAINVLNTFQGRLNTQTRKTRSISQRGLPEAPTGAPAPAPVPGAPAPGAPAPVSGAPAPGTFN